MRKKILIIVFPLFVILTFFNTYSLAKSYPDSVEKQDEEYMIMSIKKISSTTIYKQPSKDKNTTSTSGASLDDMINDADKFVDQGEAKYNGNLDDVSNMIYNILLTVGVCLAVLIGAVLGIKLMSSGIEEKAEVKKLLVPYIVGCAVIFGGFSIWKLAVILLEKI